MQLPSDTKELVKLLYKDDYGRPFELTDGQVEIFDAIFKRKYPRWHIMCYTQYGKTLTVALAVLTRVATFPEKWAVIAPDYKRAKILMGYIIQHIFDNEYTRSKFQIGPGESEERIKRERSKSRLTFNTGNGIGEVFIVSAQTRFGGEDAGNALMGFGAPNLIEDEASLIPDKIHAKAMRMIGGHKDNFLVKIGNPFKRNHFFQSFQDPEYKKIVIKWQQGVKEGRLSEDFVKEMKKQAFFDILYECEFPPAEMIEEGGWIPLLTEEEIRMAMTGGVHFGEERMGIDVAETGLSKSVIVKRSEGYAEILFKGQNVDLMDFTGQIILNAKKVNSEKRYIDKVGVGAGILSRLREQNFKIIGVNGAEKATRDQEFANKRAEMYWRVREWIKQGGKLSQDDDWLQLAIIKYKADSSGRVQIISKEELLKRGYQSPDVADALAYTFYDPPILRQIKEERIFRETLKKKKKGGEGYHLKMA